MNNVLNDVADTVRQEMDLITSLFDYIHLLPISEHEHTNLVEYECNKDEHEEEHEHEHDEDVKLLSNQIARLLKLEAKAKNTSDESITDKAKDVLAEVRKHLYYIYLKNRSGVALPLAYFQLIYMI